jgi:hypothetical protein
MNREQRRRIEKKLNATHDDRSLSEWLQSPRLTVKRGELPGVVDKIIRLHRLKRKRDRWYNRLARWLDV